ncbi:MAG: hypothetical protein HY674_06510 [Chloroflexi bacterium]|nr:hypothetical protein [Chloroflexota bacterium]
MRPSKHPAASSKWMPTAGAVFTAGLLAFLPPSQFLNLDQEERVQFGDLQNQLQYAAGRSTPGPARRITRPPWFPPPTATRPRW